MHALNRSTDTNRLLQSLEAATAAHATARKLLVCRDRSEGRELLRALVLRRGGWIGWEAATLRDLASELAFVSLAERGVRVLGDVEQAAVVDAALDRTLARLGSRSRFHAIAQGLGFRRSLTETIEALRLAGVRPEHLRSSSAPARLRDIAPILEAYLDELDSRRAADVATLLGLAVDVFAREVRYLDAKLFVLPLVGTRGASGRLLAKLHEAGASVLGCDPVVGLRAPRGLLLHEVSAASSGAAKDAPPPSPATAGDRGRPRAGSGSNLDLFDAEEAESNLELFEEAETRRAEIDCSVAEAPTPLAWLHAPEALPEDVAPLQMNFFRAASPACEIREVLRRVVAGGWRWDQVEIIASDPVVYGCALDALTSRLEIPVTYAVGLPLERSRLGRAIRSYLTWLQEGFRAQLLWEALAAGEVLPPRVNGSRSSGAAVGRQLRRLRIGWGRERYVTAVEERIPALIETADASRRSSELDPAERERARSRKERDLRSLDLFLRALIASVPASLARGSATRTSEAARTSAAELARGTITFLQFFQPRGPAERDTLERVREILERVAAAATRATSLTTALAELRGHLAIRVPPPGTVGKQPWTSAAGALHISDLMHGGRSGRPCTFVVGMDAERTAGPARQEALLMDRDRRSLAAADLPTTEERMEEARYRIAALLAGLRGTLTFSYAGWDAAEGSVLSPSPILLQALRVSRRDANLGFDDLEKHMGVPVSPVPDAGRAADAADVWLAALARGPLLLRGEGLVRESFPMLARGLAARDARQGERLGAFHGRIVGADALDPRDRVDGSISVSALEGLAACPMRWFHRYALRLWDPQDPEFDPGRWLDAGQRGRLLHSVFERFGRAFAGRQRELTGAEAEETLRRIVGEELARFLVEVPPPNPAAFATESEEILGSALVFLELERRSPEGAWEEFELTFGAPAPSVQISLQDGRTLQVHGMLDRLDRLPDGRLRIVDYKTSKTSRFERAATDPPFKGGRLLQPWLYTMAVEALRGERVAEFEYRFPTIRGQNSVSGYAREELDAAEGIVVSLLDLVRQGLFIATDDPEDCRYCDYRTICRVVEHRRVTSPPAEWGLLHGARLEEYTTLRRLRAKP